jgi:hypothetical protein
VRVTDTGECESFLLAVRGEARVRSIVISRVEFDDKTDAQLYATNCYESEIKSRGRRGILLIAKRLTHIIAALDIPASS